MGSTELKELLAELMDCAAKVRADEFGDQQARSRMARAMETAARLLESRGGAASTLASNDDD
jgi:hypothetical protein